AVPWRKYAREAKSLFWFRLVFALIGMVSIVPLVVAAVAMIINMVRRGAPDVIGVSTVVVMALLLVAVSIVFFVIGKLTTDFVVLIMFLRGSKCMEGWRELLRLISVNVGN